MLSHNVLNETIDISLDPKDPLHGVNLDNNYKLKIHEQNQIQHKETKEIMRIDHKLSSMLQQQGGINDT